MSAGPIRWGIVGTGGIAGTFSRALGFSSTGILQAVGSRSENTAEAFGDEHGIAEPFRHPSYEELFADPSVDAVYIATPHPSHAELAIAAARAGKHLLVEKPLAMSRSEADAIVAAARVADVFLMEAFMYRCHPQTTRLVELVSDGAIGDVRVVRASFGFRAHFDPAGRLFDPALGGGGILDVGCYPVSMATLIARVAGKLDTSEIEVRGAGHVGSTGVDEWAAATVRFADDLVASLATGVRVQLDNTVEVFGSEGRITVPTPWLPHEGSLVLHRPDAEPESIVVGGSGSPYAMEADALAENLASRQAPAMPWQDTLVTASILDQWLGAVGVSYPMP